MKVAKLLKTAGIALAVGGIAAVNACSRETGPTIFTPGPTAYVRFVNAVNDSGGQDWRFIDQIENTPVALNLTFRSIFPGASYQAITPGSRHLRVFQSPLDQSFSDPSKVSIDIVTTIFVDSTFTLEAGKHYTLAAVGSLRSGPAKLLILDDDYPDPGTSVSIRSVNLGLGGIDVYAGVDSLPTSPLPAALATGLANYAASPWVTMPVGSLTLRALAAGTTALPGIVTVKAPAGIAAVRDSNWTAVGGSKVAGSAFTAFIFPAAPSNSLARATVALSCPGSSCINPGVIYAVDRYPPSGF